MAVGQVIGIDLGGTSIKLGCFDRDGHCVRSLTVPTPQPASPDAVLDVMVQAIAELDPDDQTLAIGVGTPGPADADGRIARVAINLAGWVNVPLADWLEARTGKPTILANDANCAGMGEYWRGAGKPYRDLILLTLGTGVGGAVVLDGKLFVGRQGTGAELGLIGLNPDGPTCNSGNRGSLEQYASVQAIRRETGLEPDELGTRAAAGDVEAIAFWQRYGRNLGAGIASLVYVLTPEAVIIGGGVSASAEFFLPTLLDELEQRVLPSSREGLVVLTAQLGNSAGMVGAAKLAWEKWSAPSEVPTTTQTPADVLRAQLEQMQMAHRLTQELGQFKAGFLARTSHELRSPLNSVLSLHQLILSDLCDSPEEERDFVAQAQTAAKKMLDLLDQLIGISKAEAGSEQLELQPVSIKEVFERVEQLVHLQAKNRSLRLNLHAPDPDQFVLADPRWLRQALLFLISRPLTLMHEGTVNVFTQVDSDIKALLIFVEDQRPLDRWHDPLTLLHDPQPVSSDVENIPSAGLSLMVCQTLFAMMNGQLELVAAPAAVLPHGSAPSLATTTDTTLLQCRIPLCGEDLS